MRSDRLGLLFVATLGVFGAACSSGSTKAGQGGSTSRGGTMSLGGVFASGGSAASGGAVATGGTTASGGNTSGGTSAGGTVASGGAAGQVGSGGSSSLGGSSSGNGGRSSAGGNSGVGGHPTFDGGTAIDGGTIKPNVCTASDSTVAKGDSTRTIQVGGASRTYLLHVPSTYNGASAVPLVLDFHGMGDTPERQKAMSGFAALSDSDGFLIAWPAGIEQTWNFGPCCTCSKTVDDLGFAKAIVSEIEAMACIDAKRVYANGFSIGGAMTNFVACNAADVFAAATPSASDLLTPSQTPCNPVRPISVLAFRGTADPTVPYAGGASVTPNSCPATLNLLGAVASFNKWAAIDSCTGTPTTASVTNPSGTLMKSSQCAGGVEVGLYTIQGGGHAPGPGKVAWDFLKTKSLP
jgi:polyhydroxybutyrate depolymerase